jgi:hypothetical protein
MRVAVYAATLVAALAVPALAAAPGSADPDTSAGRAVDGYVAMQRYLYDVRRGSYRESVGARPLPAHAWPLSQAVAATIAVARLPGANPLFAHGAQRRLERLEDLRLGSLYTASAGGDVYYDDNEWIAQDLLDADAAWGDGGARRRALAIFAGVVRAWDADARHPCPGGISWTTAVGNDDRNTVTTANGALLGLRLYTLTRRPALLYWSRRMLDWLDGCMLAPDGLYWDHIDADGVVDRTEWSYNQGSLVAALVLLYRTTHDPLALARAERVGAAALAYFDGARLAAEPPEFAAVFFRGLHSLAAVDGDTASVDAAEAYAAQAWAQRRDPRTGLYAFAGPTRLLDQAALVQLFAALATAGR